MAVKIRLRAWAPRRLRSIVLWWRIAASPAMAALSRRSVTTIPPRASVINIDGEKAKKWIANGAQPTDTVRVLLKKSEIL